MNKPTALRTLVDHLDVLAAELLAVDDEEVLAAAAELGINPRMQGSIAMVGVTQLVPKGRSAGKKTDPTAQPSRRRRNPSTRSPKD